MFEGFSTDPVFNVKAIVRQTGISASTLRAWERRHGIPSPPRTDSGYRLYSARDVAIIRWLMDQITAGMAISQAVAYLRTRLSQVDNIRNVHTPIPAGIPATYHQMFNTTLKAIARFDEAAIEAVFAEAFVLFPIKDFCLSLLRPLLIATGDMWHTGEFTVTHEHFFSGLVQRKLFTLLDSAPRARYDQTIVCACAPDEFHELGLLMLALFLRHEGYHVVYLGQNTPPAQMDQTLRQIRPDVVLLSASQLHTAANLLEMLHTLRHVTHQGGVTPFAYGGLIFNQFPQLRQRIPGTWLGDMTEDPLRLVVHLLANRAPAPVAPLRTVSVAMHAALHELRLVKPEIVSTTVQMMMTAAGQLNSIAHDNARATEISAWLYRILDAVVSFDEPGILAETAYWEWDAATPEGLTSGQLRTCVHLFVAAAQTVLPPDLRATLQLFLDEFLQAVKDLPAHFRESQT